MSHLLHAKKESKPEKESDSSTRKRKATFGTLTAPRVSRLPSNESTVGVGSTQKKEYPSFNFAPDLTKIPARRSPQPPPATLPFQRAQRSPISFGSPSSSRSQYEVLTQQPPIKRRALLPSFPVNSPAAWQQRAISPPEQNRINRSASAGDEGGFDVPSETTARINQMQGGGQKLPDSERTFFEDRMGADFSGVRVHTDANAVQTSRDINARAFTTANHIAFNEGEYQPGTSAGRHLLAHELTHTIQQGGAIQPAKLARTSPAKSKTSNQSHDSDHKMAQIVQLKGDGGTTKVDNASARVNANTPGNFSKGFYGKNQTYQYVNRNGKMYVRKSPQMTKDKNTLKEAGKKPDSISGANKPFFKGEIKAEAKTGGTLFSAVNRDKDNPYKLLDEPYGTMTGELEVLKGSGELSGSATLSKEGIEIKAAGAAKLTIAGGKLKYEYDLLEFEFLGEEMGVKVAAEVSAEVAASVGGDIGLNIGKADKGVQVKSSAGLEAFAGAKGGLKIIAQGTWKSSEGNKDIIGAFVGIEGWAGAAAVAKFTASLSPTIKYEGYLGAAVGLGAAGKFGIEINALDAAKLTAVLTKKGVKVAWDGLTEFAEEASEWAEDAYDWAGKQIDKGVDLVKETYDDVGKQFEEIYDDAGKQFNKGVDSIKDLFRKPVQTKLTVNEPDDQYEQEADRVADTVMRMPSPMVAYPNSVNTEPPPIQAQLIARVHAAREEASQEPPSVTPALENRIAGMSGGGSPLPDTERNFFESRMGADFSGVRIHTNANAVQTSRELNARAFTVGNNVAFNAGEYQPGTSAGRRLMAHELTHVVQQNGAAVKAKAGGRVLQRTYVATRQLDAMGLKHLGKPWDLGGNPLNLGLYHAHIFFEDGKTPSNIGFFKHGLGQEDSKWGNSDYTKTHEKLDDAKMRKAVEKHTSPAKYHTLHNNCQDWIERVMRTYNDQDPDSNMSLDQRADEARQLLGNWTNNNEGGQLIELFKTAAPSERKELYKRIEGHEWTGNWKDGVFTIDDDIVDSLYPEQLKRLRDIINESGPERSATQKNASQRTDSAKTTEELSKDESGQPSAFTGNPELQES